jgi:phosphate:Na+ symporter
MGQNIGTCVTALISSTGTSRNAKRAALVHLSFNVIGAVVWLTIFCVIKAAFAPVILMRSASLMGIAGFHTVFNVLCTALMLPLGGVLEKLVCKLIPDAKQPEKAKELDERLLGSPALALNQCKQVLVRMACAAVDALKTSLTCIEKYDGKAAAGIRKAEDETDRLEDLIGTYLLKLTSRQLGEEESIKATEYMKLVGDYERIADHAVNILESAEEMVDKGVTFTDSAVSEFKTICAAVTEILDLSYRAFSKDDFSSARKTEPLEQVIDVLKETLRTRHFIRLQKGECSVAAGFVWSDLLTNLERVSDHCSNISGCVLDTADLTMNIHENQRIFRDSDEDYRQQYSIFQRKYKL